MTDESKLSKTLIKAGALFPWKTRQMSLCRDRDYDLSFPMSARDVDDTIVQDMESWRTNSGLYASDPALGGSKSPKHKRMHLVDRKLMVQVATRDLAREDLRKWISEHLSRRVLGQLLCSSSGLLAKVVKAMPDDEFETLKNTIASETSPITDEVEDLKDEEKMEESTESSKEPASGHQSAEPKDDQEDRRMTSDCEMPPVMDDVQVLKGDVEMEGGAESSKDQHPASPQN